MLRRRPESSETLPSALLAPRTSFRKIASARTLNAPKSCDLACARDAHRRSDKASIVRSAPPGPPTGRSATHKRSLRPEPATLAGLRAAWRASSLRRGLSASVCRALPATPRAPFKRCQSRSVHWTRHMRDRPRFGYHIPVVERLACKSSVSGALTVSVDNEPLPCSDSRVRAAL